MTYPWSAALVTGASSGIGEKMVRLLAGQRVKTVVVARRVDRLEQLAKELDGIEVLAADLLTEAGIGNVAARLTDQERPIELLVNNAGFGTSGQFQTLDTSRLGLEIDLNVRALVQLTSAAIGPMVERKRGWILNVSSLAGFQPVPSMAVYGATKAFVTTFSEAIHEELRSSGVKVTALCPGYTKTEFQTIANTSGLEVRLPKMLWTQADDVARIGLADCARGRALSIPGAANKIVAAVSGPMPRRAVRRAVGFLSQYPNNG